MDSTHSVFSRKTCKKNEIPEPDGSSLEEEVMRNVAKSSIVFGLIAALICLPFATSALAQEYFEAKEPGGGAMIYDMVVIRPIGLVATVVGSAFWLVSLPFSALGDNVGTATDKLVKEPAAYTFKRPLGEF
jgi:ABC-type Fe3+ transport system permease subunit